MKNTTRRMLSSACALALAANGFSGAMAQEKKERTERQTVERTVIVQGEGQKTFTIQTDGQGGTFNVRVPEPGAAGFGGPEGFNAVWVNGGGGMQQFGDGTFQFFSEGMSFDNRLVKGAPFSADTVSETAQTLADGNRIVQRSEGHISRDSQGRTRTERTFRMGGSNTERQTITIFDPESGTNLILDPQTRTARKMTSFLRTPSLFAAPTASAIGAASGVEPLKKINTAGILQGNAVKKVQPSYPAVAKAAQAEGAVQVQVSINESGEVSGAQAVAGHPLLREAAVEAARQWQFKPTEVDGQAVKAQGVLTFNFTLQKNETAPQGAGAAGGFGFGGVMMKSNANTKTEALGKQMIEGVECEGKRRVTTIPAGDIGNERAIETIHESWYSPELQMTIMTKQTDPRFGESTYRVTNINRSEPDASLFQAPNDYSVKEGGSFSFGGDAIRFKSGGEAIEMKRRTPPQQ
jgi:TonB family protein